MKKHIFTALIFSACSAGLVSAQNLAKRYVFLEHFTNTRCSICASKNPAFYNVIKDFPNDVHHVSIHSHVPYSSCAFYQHNKTDNDARANLYNIFGTPTLALNGVELPPASPLISKAAIQAELTKTSPIAVKVAQSGSGNQRTANIEVESLGSVPPGSYSLVTFVVEKKVNYAGPNGESVHHDVLRKTLPDADGEVFAPAAQGDKKSFAYTFNMDAAWVASEIYVLVFVQKSGSNEVLNSGSSLDPNTVSSPEIADNQTFVKVSPNPVSTHEFRVNISGESKIGSWKMLDFSGKVVRQSYPGEQFSGEAAVETGGLGAGVYWLEVVAGGRRFVEKVVLI